MGSDSISSSDLNFDLAILSLTLPPRPYIPESFLGNTVREIKRETRKRGGGGVGRGEWGGCLWHDLILYFFISNILKSLVFEFAGSPSAGHTEELGHHRLACRVWHGAYF